MVQLYFGEGEGASGEAALGVYAAYAGEDDHLCLLINPEGSQLLVEGKREGNAIDGRTIALGGEVGRTCNLRIIRLEDRIIAMVDGKQVLEMPGAWPASRVGLIARGMVGRFDGVTCFWI